MKISVIIPVYNVEKYLQRCLQSVQNQSYKDFEVILVNDGSTDSSRTICEKFVALDKRFYLIDKKNEGVSAARNTGIIHSTGYTLCFIDSDDDVLPEYLSSMVYDWNSIEKTELVFQGVKRIFTNGEYIKTNIPNLVVNSADTSVLFNDGKISLNGNPVSKLFKSSIIKDHHLFFNKEFTYNEDMIFVLEYILFCKNKVVFSDSIHYNYYINPGSVTNSVLKPHEYLKPYLHYKKLFLDGYCIKLDDQKFSVIYDNFKINLHMFMNSALLHYLDPREILSKEDWQIYYEVSKRSESRRKFLDFFIFRKIYFVPRVIIKFFLQLKP